jgi:hypothetical protein
LRPEPGKAGGADGRWEQRQGEADRAEGIDRNAAESTCADRADCDPGCDQQPEVGDPLAEPQTPLPAVRLVERTAPGKREHLQHGVEQDQVAGKHRSERGRSGPEPAQPGITPVGRVEDTRDHEQGGSQQEDETEAEGEPVQPKGNIAERKSLDEENIYSLARSELKQLEQREQRGHRGAGGRDPAVEARPPSPCDPAGGQPEGEERKQGPDSERHQSARPPLEDQALPRTVTPCRADGASERSAVWAPSPGGELPPRSTDTRSIPA